jgi:hypothetical protein
LSETYPGIKIAQALDINVRSGTKECQKDRESPFQPSTLTHDVAVQATLAELSERLPPGLTYLVQHDSATFVSDTITKVLKTLGEAFVPVHGQVPPRLIIVASVRSENPAKMCFA